MGLIACGQRSYRRLCAVYHQISSVGGARFRELAFLTGSSWTEVFVELGAIHMSKSKKDSKPRSAGKQSTVSKGRIIEAIVASMHESVGVKVERNVKLPPIGSQEPTREIDVLL